jgi:hypothetical protein
MLLHCFSLFCCNSCPPCDALTTIIRIPQLDEHEVLPIDAWLRDNSLDFSSSSSSVKTDAVDAATLTDDKVFVDVGAWPHPQYINRLFVLF